jgi:predicted dehydrogenase
MVYSLREASAGRRAGAGLEFFGDKGSLTIGRTGFEVHPDPRIDPASAIPVFAGHPAGGPRRQNHAAAPWTQPVKDHGSSEEQFERHARNFLDCVKSRQRPVADVEDGHRTAAACHLANISLRTGRKIRWDADREEILDDREAAAMLERPYRPPWDAVARSLIGG